MAVPHRRNQIVTNSDQGTTHGKGTASLNVRISGSGTGETPHTQDVGTQSSLAEQTSVLSLPFLGIPNTQLGFLGIPNTQLAFLLPLSID